MLRWYNGLELVDLRSPQLTFQHTRARKVASQRMPMGISFI